MLKNEEKKTWIGVLDSQQKYILGTTQIDNFLFKLLLQCSSKLVLGYDRQGLNGDRR